MIDSEMNSAAAASAHHQPRPMPMIPAMPAKPVCQSAFCISASVWSTLSRMRVAIGCFRWPRIIGGTTE